MSQRPRKSDRAAWARTILRHLEDFPRQYGALETAMAGFGDEFDLAAFKQAFETRDDLEAYNRVQAVERAAGRVQNYVAELAEAGVKLAQLAPPQKEGSSAERAFETLRKARVIDASLCRRLIRAQRARSMIEHAYIRTPAGDVHRAVQLVHGSSREFLGTYRDWIADHLEASRGR